jgi:hypothetical protein
VRGIVVDHEDLDRRPGGGGGGFRFGRHESMIRWGETGGKGSRNGPIPLRN